MRPPTTGLLIIRAWLEDDPTHPLRAQIRSTTDVSLGFERSVTVADLISVRDAMDGWLAEVLVSPSSARHRR